MMAAKRLKMRRRNMAYNKFFWGRLIFATAPPRISPLA
jgi:hypothetical protein